MSSLPATLGKYQIIREIARSNDIVYEAYDPLMNRRVALKELSMPGGSTPQQKEERVSRFKREARAAGTLAHPNIMTVYELGEEGDRYFIAMEFLDGKNLRNELDTSGALGIDRAVVITNEVLKGLAFAHEKGVIHRDIKPDNIQILADGRIKLTDFGIARLTFEPNLTMDGQVFGTPSYMSPEQVVGREIDARSDLFSVGILLYEMIGGRKPFPGDSVVSITYAIMNKEPERLQEANYSVWQVIERALDKSPALRYKDANEFMAALKSATSNTGPVLDNAPPVNNPYGGQSYSQQSGQQYGQQGGQQYGAQGNPYLIPTPGLAAQSYAPTPPPVLYAYNPYASAPPSGAMGSSTVPTANTNIYSPTYVPNPTGLPIYYPPPPRVPLFKPETRDFLGKLCLWLVVGCTLVGVVYVLIAALSAGLQSHAQQEQDAQVAYAVNSAAESRPLDDRIKTLEAATKNINSPVVKAQEEALTATLYQARGRRAFDTRNYVEAERNFQRANELDPTNSAYYSDLGRVYDQVAKEIDDAQQRSMVRGRSSESWIHAASVEQNPTRRTQLRDGAARATLNYANDLASMGRVSDARAQLLDARGFASPNSEVSDTINTLLENLER